MATYPLRDTMMPDFNLPSLDGREVRLSDFRQRRNVVLVFIDSLDDDGSRRILSLLALRHSDFLREEAEVLVVIPCSPREAESWARASLLPFPVLSDEQGIVGRDAGATARDGRPAKSLFIVDRFGEVLSAFRTGEGHPFPTPGEVLDWVRYIESQCPE